jgi:hypothetical protein
MNKFLFVTSIIIISLQMRGCSSCYPKNDKSSRAGNGNNSGYNENTIDKTNAEHNSRKVSYTERYGNTITIPVKFDEMRLDMIFDTGGTCITVAETQYLCNKGKLTENDNVNEIMLEDVEAVVVHNQQTLLLLGQLEMKQFYEILMDR